MSDQPCFNNCTPKKGLHLEIFDPSGCMIEPGKDGSKLVIDAPRGIVLSMSCNMVNI